MRYGYLKNSLGLEKCEKKTDVRYSTHRDKHKGERAELSVYQIIWNSNYTHRNMKDGQSVRLFVGWRQQVEVT
jgi:hypothetical protein